MEDEMSWSCQANERGEGALGKICSKNREVED